MTFRFIKVPVVYSVAERYFKAEILEIFCCLCWRDVTN